MKKSENTFLFKELLKEQFPPTMTIVHLIVFCILLITILPLLIFTDRFLGSEWMVILLLVAVFLFILVTSGIFIMGLYQWNSQKNELYNAYKDKGLVKLENLKVTFGSEISLMNLKEAILGSPPRSTKLGFEHCDLLIIENSLIVFGKGASILSPSKGVYAPFEINLNNEFLTDHNQVKLIGYTSTKNHTEFELVGVGIWKKFNFRITIQGFSMDSSSDNTASSSC